MVSARKLSKLLRFATKKYMYFNASNFTNVQRNIQFRSETESKTLTHPLATPTIQQTDPSIKYEPHADNNVVSARPKAAGESNK
jgi:hypothetical protein